MTTHNYKVLKNYPVQFTVKSPKHYWQTINTAYGEDTTMDVELVPFEGLEYTFNNPLVTFSRQTLLDGTILEEQTKILAESGKEWTYGDGTYMGCLRSMMDVPNEKTYNVDIVDGEAVLTTGNNQGLWGGQITIPAHDVVIS